MVFGISLSAYTTIHVIISLIAIVTGFIAVFQMIADKPLGIWNTIFLWTTIATSVTGFGFPITGITPGIVVGIISLVILAVALFALYAQNLAGPWRWIYFVSAIVALSLNVFVLIVQSFQKIRVPQDAGANAVRAAIPDRPGRGAGAVRRAGRSGGAEIPADCGVEGPAISAIIRAVASLSPAELYEGGSGKEEATCCNPSRC